MAAVRAALNLRGRQEREVPTRQSQLAALSPPIDDPVLRGLKAQFAGEFKDALGRACLALGERDRTVLRRRFVDGLNIEQIGAIYGTHRATVARWIARIREELFVGTRAELRVALRVDDSDFDSMLRIAQSQLDVSLSRVLGSAEG